MTPDALLADSSVKRGTTEQDLGRFGIEPYERHGLATRCIDSPC